MKTNLYKKDIPSLLPTGFTAVSERKNITSERNKKQYGYRMLVVFMLFLFCSARAKAGTIFVSTSGNNANSGASWTAAKGPTYLTTLAGTNLPAGTTIYMKAGSYTYASSSSIALSNNNILIQGGFPASNIGTSTAGYDPVANLTTINLSVNNSALFGSNGTGLASNTIQIKGLKFTTSVASSSVLGGGNNDGGSFQFTDDIISGFTSPSGVISFGGFNFGGTSVFTNTVFTGNSGGAVVAGNCVEAFNISNCSFTNNTSPSGIILTCYTGTLNITNSSFCNNSSTNTTGGPFGGVITNAVDNSIKWIISGSTFSGNTSATGPGAIYTSTGTFQFTNCSFLQNINNSTATGGGAIFVAHPGSTNTLDGCTFYNNGCPSNTAPVSGTANGNGPGGGAINIGYNNTNYTISNSSFVKNYVSSASSGGAIMMINDQGTNATVQNCLFNGNYIGSSNNTTVAGSDIIAHGAGGFSGILTINTDVLQQSGQSSYKNYAGTSTAGYTFTGTNTYNNTTDNVGAPTYSCRTLLGYFISGTVWNDANANIVFDGTESGTNAGGTVYVNLVDATTSTLVKSVAVASDGTYTGLTAPLGGDSYILVLTTSATGKTPAVPGNYVNTGENIGSNTATQSSTPGQIELPTSFNSSTLNAQNFGIVQPGYIYLHKKTLDESSSTDFTFSGTGISSIILNDNPTQTPLKDLGSSQSGRLYAVGNSDNTLYYRDTATGAWLATSITNASRVDGGPGKTCYVVTTSGGVISFDGTTGTTIGAAANYGSSNASDIGSTWDNQPYITTAAGAIWRYSGTGTTWAQVGATTNNLWVDGNPATGNIIVAKTDKNIYSITSSAVETSLGKPAGTNGTNPLDVAVDISGNIFSSYNYVNGVSTLAFVTQWSSGTTWNATEASSRKAIAITGGAGNEIWAVIAGPNSALIAPYSNIFTRTYDGTNAYWIDDERVHTSPARGNSGLIAVVPGTYTITETVPAGWDLQGITLYDPTNNSTTNVVGNSATLVVASGETINAVYQNGVVNPFAMTNSCATAYTEDFGSGAINSYGNALTGQTSYHYMGSGTAGTNADDGYYEIVGKTSLFASWATSMNDHTTNDGTGYMMVVNASYDQNEFFRRRFTGLVIGATYNFSAWVASVSNGVVKPNVSFKVVDPTNYSTLASTSTGDITTAGVWNKYTLSFTATATTIDLILQNNTIGGAGNDLALDDISFALVPPQTPIATTITNNGSGGCFTSGNIQVTAPVGASYEYSLDNSTYQSSVNFNTLSPAFYTVYARYVGTTGCVINKADTIRAYVCGNVYDDANGLKDNLVNSSIGGTNAGGVLKAVLYDNTAGKVSAITTVASDGTYSVGALPANNSSIYLTTNTATLWQTTIPTAALPYGPSIYWVNTGEHIGTGTGSDVTVDGILPLGTVSASVTNANFGIDQLPSGVPISYQINPVPTRGSTHALDGSYRNMLPLGYYDAEDCASVCPNSFGVVITALTQMNGNILAYNGTTINIANLPFKIPVYNPSLLTVTFNQSGLSSFTFHYQVTDAAGMQSIDPDYTAYWGGTVLAVNLLNFTAEQQGETALLKWSTAAGSINDKFTIERNADSRNWTALKTIAGTGGSSTRQNYSYADNSPLSGSNYYRIKQVDKDGNNVYSETKLLKFGEKWIVSLSPNPVAGGEVKLVSNQPVSMIRITDLQGRTVFVKSMPVTNVQGSVNEELNTNGIASGTYLVQISNSDGKTQTLKLIKW